MSSDKEFDPSKHLTDLKGSDYLEVKWRLVWLRSKHPDAVIETDCVSFNDTHAVFKATVSIPNGGSATGWGSETKNDFRDYIEKAETKSLGRALGALGFGTQFSQDFEFGADAGRVVDAPVRPQNAPRRDEAPRPVSAPGEASSKQLGMIRGLARQKGISDDRLAARCSQLYNVALDHLTKGDASDLIERLNALPDPSLDADDTHTHNDSAYEEVVMFDAAHPAEHYRQ